MGGTDGLGQYKTPGMPGFLRAKRAFIASLSKEIATPKLPTLLGQGSRMLNFWYGH